MISEKTLSKIVRALEKHGEIIGVRELSELSGVAIRLIPAAGAVTVRPETTGPHIRKTNPAADGPKRQSARLIAILACCGTPHRTRVIHLAAR